MTLGKSPALSAPQFVPLQRARAGTVTSLSRSLPPVTLPPPHFGSGHITPPHTLPKARLPPTPSIPEGMALPFPVHVCVGGAWQALGSRQGQEVPEQSQPFKPPACREHWPAASLHGRDTEGHLSGGPRFASEPLRSPLPHSQVAALLGGGMWAAPLWEGGGKEGRRATWTGCPQ